MRPMFSLAVAALALVGCDTPADPPPHAPVLRGISASYGFPARVAGEVTFGEPEIDGPLGADALAAVFDARGGELEFCYQHALESSRDEPRGHLVVAFTITDAGRVAPPVSFAEDTVGSAVLADCVAQTLGGWTFAAPASEVRVRYPMDVSFEPPPPG